MMNIIMVFLGKLWDEVFKFTAIAFAIFGIYFLAFSECSPIDISEIWNDGRHEVTKQVQQQLKDVIDVSE